MSIYMIYFFIIFIINLLICQNLDYCGISQIQYSPKFPRITNYLDNNNNEYRPIQIYLDSYIIENDRSLKVDNKGKKIIEAFNFVVKIVQKLIKVQPLNYKISIRNDDLKEWDYENYIKEELKEENGVDKDLVILIDAANNCQSSFEIKYIDELTKRPILGIIYLNFNFDFNKNNADYNLQCILMHQLTHILGFYKEIFPNFKVANGDINKILLTVESDKRSNVQRSYIKSAKVLEYAKKYYNCNSLLGVELEDQDGKTNSHWEARTLLGEYMNAEPYIPEQVISEFTLALLEDSGWYQIKYYTGGLMRFGKNKKCEFLDSDCIFPTKFENEFYNINSNNYDPACSSGRQSRVYIFKERGIIDIEFSKFPNYFRSDNNGYYGKGVENADFCLAYNSLENEESAFGNYVGSCKYGNGNYGVYISYSNGISSKRNSDFPKNFGEKYGNDSFCVLTSLSVKGSTGWLKFDNNIIHPMCYPMYCSDKSLTIQIYEQYVVCPRSGGKVKVDGIYEGFLFCPDYNLICTGSVMCNNMFDCVEKESTIKSDTYEYGYEIKTSQIKNNLINAVTLIGFELSENNTICPQYCEQCKELKKCFKCKSGMNLIGIKENDENPIICNETINISIGYYQNEETKIYYPCTEFCDQCNKTHCLKCDNIHKINKDENKTCIDKVFNCEKYNETFDCIKCKENYSFIEYNRDECYIINKSKYYSLDDGISYFPCNKSIAHCDICNNNNLICTKCDANYYFIEDNRTHCRNDADLSEYFSEDEKISYYPCNSSIKNCQKCNSKNSCTKCYNNYYLIIQKDKDICIDSVDDRYYTENGGKSYYPCNESINFCERCQNKKICIKCNENYGFFENNKDICVYLGDNEYYTMDNGKTYYLCRKLFPNCHKCYNNVSCYQCLSGYYFIADDRHRCYNDKNLSKYYTENGGYSYYLCENNCDTCYNKSICKTCKNNYYFIRDIRSECFKIDIEKYYSKNGGISYILCSDSMSGCEKCKVENICDLCQTDYYFLKREYNKCYNIDIRQYYYEEDTKSYFPCNTKIDQCDYCFNDRTCNKCFEPYIILFESPFQCYEENNYKYDKTYFKLNESFYEKCSTSINHCKYCNSIDYCEECDLNYYFLNKNYSQCILESTLVPKDEYYKVDEKNYYSCSFKEESIENCKKCTNGTICLQCKDSFAFVSNNLKECISKDDLNKKYYPNGDGTMYFPCIQNCDICKNNETCVECTSNYVGIYDNTQCDLCEISIINIQDELLNEDNGYISDYINSSKDKISKVSHYINNIYNYTITIFKVWECTYSLLDKDYFKLNTRELILLISKKLNIDKSNIIFYFMTKNFNNYLEIYNEENGQKIDLLDICPECINIGFEIKNNFTKEMKEELGIVGFEKIKNHNIDIFNNKEPYINDICHNFTISNIDLSIQDRRKYFNYANSANKIICIDDSCEIKSKEISDFTGNCHCPIKTDFNSFKIYQVNISPSSDEIKSYDVSLVIFKCFKAGFSKTISSNMGFYLFLFFIIFQIICFVIFIIFENKIKPIHPNKKSLANPPLYNSKDGILFIEDLNIIEGSNNVNNFSNQIQDIQDKDEGSVIEDVSFEDYIGIFDNSRNTELDDEDTTKRKVKKNSKNQEEEKKKDIKDDDDDYMSKNQFIQKKKKTSINYNYKLNDKYRDFLNLNNPKKVLNNYGARNRKHKNKMSESFYLHSEGNKFNKTTNYNKKNEIMENRRIKTQDNEKPDDSIKSQEQLYKIRDNINKIKRSILGSAYNLNKKETESIENFSFCGFYWYLLGLKQPILNLTSSIKIFKITQSFIPSGIKGIRFIFMIGLNIFINALLISQKYISKKFNHFNEKYNLRFIELGMDVPTNERFSYAFKNTIVNSLISFAICFIFQAILNYLYFNIRNKIDEIIKNDNNVEEEIIDFLGIVMLKYKFLFIIDIILMILFFCYMVNFSAVYRGGDLDYISASIMTFIFLQIFPFFICFILTLIRYLGLKVSSEKLYKISQIMAY